MGGEDDRSRRNLVEVTDLEPDHAVLDVVDDANAVAAPARRRPLQELYQAEPLAVQRHGAAPLEADPHELGLIGRVLRTGDELEDVLARGLGEVLDRPALRGTPPEVVVDRVRRRLASALHGDPVLPRVSHLLLAPHPPLADRR